MKNEHLIVEADLKLKEALDSFLTAQRKCKGGGSELESELRLCHDHILFAVQHILNVKALLK